MVGQGDDSDPNDSDPNAPQHAKGSDTFGI